MRRKRMENRCTNCVHRKKCKHRGAVVEWKNCPGFQPDLALGFIVAPIEECDAVCF